MQDTSKKEVLEYLFFTAGMATKFTTKLTELGLTEGQHWQQEQEPIHDAFLVKVFETDDIEDWDNLWDKLDALFDDYTIEDQRLFEENCENLDTNTVGVYIQLKDGSQTIAAVNPDVLNRILGVLSNEEFAEFVDTIVTSVETPDDSAICKR